MLELDIMRTRDDEIICCHDEYMGRLTGRHHDAVADFNYADLPPMLSALPDDSEDFVYTLTEKDDPTWLKLGDLFADMPDNVFYSIDLKASNKGTAALVFAIVKAYGVEKRVVWGSSV